MMQLLKQIIPARLDSMRSLTCLHLHVRQCVYDLEMVSDWPSTCIKIKKTVYNHRRHILWIEAMQERTQIHPTELSLYYYS